MRMPLAFPNMTTLKERLKLAMAGPPKVSQAELARVCKVSAPSVNDWYSGKTKTMAGPHLLAAAARLGVNPQWLATGRGPMRMNDSQQATPDKPSGDAGPPSHPATLTRDILHEALSLLNHDEGGGTRAYGPHTRTNRLYELICLVLADGGRLTEEHNAEFEEQVQARAQGVANGNELAKRRPAARRKRG